MGLFNKNKKGNLFGRNDDGKTLSNEEFVAYQIFEACTNNSRDDEISENALDFLLESEAARKYAWRKNCDDGSEFEVDPVDYETEEDYNEALEEAKYEWRDFCDDGSEFGIYPCSFETLESYDEAIEEAKYAWQEACDDDPEFEIYPDDYETKEEYKEALCKAQSNSGDVNIPISFSVEIPCLNELDKIKENDFPNKRRYNAAYTLTNQFQYYCDKEYEKKQKACCRFILEKSDAITAANYLTLDGDFLYSQAIKDNFKLPVTLPDEDENAEADLYEIILKIEKKNVPICFEVWTWCLEQFLPYAEYTNSANEVLTSEIINAIYDFSDEFITAFIKYITENPEFRKTVIRNTKDVAVSISDLIVDAIKLNLFDTAKALFEDSLFVADGKQKSIINLINEIISAAKTYEELECIEYIEAEILPIIKIYEDDKTFDNIVEWEKEIAKYKSEVEQTCEQYAYTRSNSWRLTVPDGKEYYLDPCDFYSKTEYLEAFNEEKSSWQKQ